MMRAADCPVARRVVLTGGSAYVALVEPVADEYALAVDAGAASLALPLVPYDAGQWVVDGVALTLAIETALRLGASLGATTVVEERLPAATVVALLGHLIRASELTYAAPGQHGDQVRDALRKAVRLVGGDAAADRMRPA